MNVDIVPESDIGAALRAYGIEPDGVSYLTSGCYCTVYRVDADGKEYIARLRSPSATPPEVLFAARWARAVSSEVPVPVPLMPVTDVPTIAGRCLDVAPYVPHEHTNGGDVSPDAWVQVGRMLGSMHRLGLPLTGDAPQELPYGNYPHERLVRGYVSRAKMRVPHAHHANFERAESLLARALEAVARWKSDLSVGVVHGDMHFWNVLYAEGVPVSIIDFDFLQRGILVFDIAYAHLWLSPWERERGDEWRNIADKYIRAYEETRQQALSFAERACLPWCQVWLNVFFFLSSLQCSVDNLEKSIEDDLLPAEALAATL